MRTLSAALATTCLTALPAFSQTDVRLGLDWSYLPYHAAIVLADQNGYFEEEGINLVYEPGRGSGSTAIMLGEGNYDIAHINSTNAAVAISKGVPIQVVGIYQTRTAASFIGFEDVVDLDSVESIKGYRIGSTPGGSDQLSLKVFQAANDLSDSDLDVVSLDANAKQVALFSGNIAIISGDNFAYSAIIRGRDREPEVFSLADAGVPLLGFGYSVNREFAEANPEAVTGFLRAIQRGWQDVVSDITSACEVARDELELTHTQAACVDYVGGLVDISVSPSDPAWGEQSDDMWEDLISILTDVGEISSDHAISDYYTNKYLPAE